MMSRKLKSKGSGSKSKLLEEHETRASGSELNRDDVHEVDEEKVDEEQVDSTREHTASEPEIEGSEDDVALDEVESLDAPDVIAKQKIEIDNDVAMKRIRESIQLDPSLAWTETLCVSYSEAIDVDVNDDLQRELAFYKQALEGANTARTLAHKNKLPFSRPSDYFAEMVKSDAHMERIRQRLLDEKAEIKRSQQKRKEREGKKFGKQVQVERLKEREQNKKDMASRLKGLKRKRGGGVDDLQEDDGQFDVAVEDAISDRPAKRLREGRVSRQARDSKYGFGGKGKRSKQNTRESTEDFKWGSSKKAKGSKGGAKPKRLGKSRRTNVRR